MGYYYMIPYNELPTTPDTNMHYASWSTTANTVVWSTTQPTTAPDGVSTFVVGVTTTYPTSSTHATQLAAVPQTKTGPTEPPISASDVPSFVTAFNDWMDAYTVKGYDIPAGLQAAERR